MDEKERINSTTNDAVRNKVIVLYIVNRLPGITSAELTSLATDTCYMNYFEFALTFDSLINTKMIQLSQRKNESETDSSGKPVQRCDISPNGVTSLNRLFHLIPPHIHSFLNQAFRNWEKDSKKTGQVKAGFDPGIFGGYTVKLSLNDGMKDLIKLELSVPDRDMASTICDKWKTDTQTGYLEILKILTKEN